MATEITLPIEFVVDGLPKSAQRGGGGSNERWKDRVRAAAAKQVKDQAPSDAPLVACVYIFPQAELPGDLDNKLKFIFDALTDLVYESDSQIKRLDVRAFEPRLGMTYAVRSAMLDRIATDGRACVYLRFSDDLNEVT